MRINCLRFYRPATASQLATLQALLRYSSHPEGNTVQLTASRHAALCAATSHTALRTTLHNVIVDNTAVGLFHLRVKFTKCKRNTELHVTGYITTL